MLTSILLELKLFSLLPLFYSKFFQKDAMQGRRKVVKAVKFALVDHIVRIRRWIYICLLLFLFLSGNVFCEGVRLPSTQTDRTRAYLYSIGSEANDPVKASKSRGTMRWHGNKVHTTINVTFSAYSALKQTILSCLSLNFADNDISSIIFLVEKGGN